MTAENAIQALISTARKHLGYHEECDNHTIFASAYDFDQRLYGFDMSGLPWCDFFVDWCFMVTFGFDLGSSMTYQFAGCSGASCAASAGYYKDHRAWFQNPEVGDQIFFYVSGWINHTGIVSDVCGNQIRTIEGNSSEAVNENWYSITDQSIAGYGRPNWNAAARFDPDNINPYDPIPADFTPTFDSYLDADGEYGPLTESTVRDFQKAFGLKDHDGIAGPDTFGKIFELINMELVKKGSVGWLVTALQALLNHIGQEY